METPNSKIAFKDVFYFKLLKIPYIKYSNTFIREYLKEKTPNYERVYEFLKSHNPSNIFYDNQGVNDIIRFIFFKDNYKYSCLYDIDQETYNSIPKNFYSEMIEPNIVKSEIVYKPQKINFGGGGDTVVINDIITILDEEIFESILIQRLNVVDYMGKILGICGQVLKRKLKLYYSGDGAWIMCSDDGAAECYCIIPHDQLDTKIRNYLEENTKHLNKNEIDFYITEDENLVKYIIKSVFKI